jgi:MFS family permease
MRLPHVAQVKLRDIMATQVRHPIWLPALKTPGAHTFAMLYAVESFARASVSSVIPIQIYDVLRDEQAVSLVYTAVALAGISVTLFMPLLIERFARRWVYTAGVGGLILGALLFLTPWLWSQMAGMLCRVMGASALSITLNLYIMDHIRKTQFIRSESMRLAWSTFAWTGGPTLGVFLYANHGILAAQMVAIVTGLALLALFWFFRLSDNPMIRPGATRPASPLANIGRFLRQPRLRLAWLIAFGRSCFWTTFFVYAPILMVTSGEGELAGGLLVSAANALLFSALIWGWAGRRFGARKVMAGAFVVTGAMLLGAGAAGSESPRAAAIFLLLAAFFCIALDALGSTAFMRSVRVWERARMTAVYRTYLDLSELLPPLVYSVTLAFFGLGSVFATLGVFVTACGVVTFVYLPKKM